MSGPSDDYTGYDEGVVEAALDSAWDDYDTGSGGGSTFGGGGGAAGGGGGGGGEASGSPTRMRVSAEIEWAGVKDRARGGQRTTTLDGLNLTGVRDALNAARKAEGRAASAGGSLRAKGWAAQLSAITKGARGERATGRAGLSPTARTMRSWLTGSRTPSKANREKIEKAYGEMRNEIRQEARGKADRARHELSRQLSSSLEQRYGAEIRLRNIQNIDLS